MQLVTCVIARSAACVWLGVVFHFKHLSRNAFAVMTTTIWPLVYASLAFFMFRAGAEPEALLLASLGATVMGIWSVTTVDAADSIQRQRWLGMLELLVAAPTPFWAVLLPITIAIVRDRDLLARLDARSGAGSSSGSRSTLEQPLLFALAIPPTIVSIGLLGFLMASRSSASAPAGRSGTCSSTRSGSSPAS